MSSQANANGCYGFRHIFPQGTNQIITSVQLIPAHKPGENVSPWPETIKALWDTGATSSTIRPELADKYGLFILKDGVVCNGANGQYSTKEYLTGLVLPNGILIHEMRVTGFQAPPTFDMLIGMDIIRLGDFLISTENGVPFFSFQIPSLGGFHLDGIQAVQTSKGMSYPHGHYAPVVKGPKIGRNDACPCGSGKKYKNCHGKNR